MFRSIFFSIGLFTTMWGVSLLLVDKMVLNLKDDHPKKKGEFRGIFTTTDKDNKRVIDPPDWAAFSLMSIGTVTMLYTVALPKKKYD